MVLNKGDLWWLLRVLDIVVSLQPHFWCFLPGSHRQWGSWYEVRNHDHLSSLFNDPCVPCLISTMSKWHSHMMLHFMITLLKNRVSGPNCCCNLGTICRLPLAYFNNPLRWVGLRENNWPKAREFTWQDLNSWSPGFQPGTLINRPHWFPYVI